MNNFSNTYYSFTAEQNKFFVVVLSVGATFYCFFKKSPKNQLIYRYTIDYMAIHVLRSEPKHGLWDHKRTISKYYTQD